MVGLYGLALKILKSLEGNYNRGIDYISDEVPKAIDFSVRNLFLDIPPEVLEPVEEARLKRRNL